MSSVAVAKLGTLVRFDPAGREETKRRLLRLVSFQPHLIAEATGGRLCDIGGRGGGGGCAGVGFLFRVS